MSWFQVKNEEELLTPGLLVFPEYVASNISTMLEMVDGDASRLRPHVKTYKMKEVVQMQLDRGITKFKCATIAEAEMLAHLSIEDILLAYQPVGPAIPRLFDLKRAFPKSRFSALVDNHKSLGEIAKAAAKNDTHIDLFIDLDVGMHRTGIAPDKALDLGKEMISHQQVNLLGLHMYDGHLRDSSLTERTRQSDLAIKPAFDLRQKLEKIESAKLEFIAGGSPTFPIHAKRKEVICSPGTTLFWDWGYHSKFPDMEFKFAGLVATRIISKPGSKFICVDLGHKAVAADQPLPRVKLLNLPDGKVVSQSEEHLLIEVSDNSKYEIGQVLYGIPLHICPTCALHAHGMVVREQTYSENWEVVSRNRKISI